MPDDIVGEAGRPNGLSRSTCERLVLQLLGMGVLSDDFHFTAFAVVHYVVTGARAHALETGRIPQVLFQVPGDEGGPDEGKAKKKGSAATAAGHRGKGRGVTQREEEDLEGSEASVANVSATGQLSGGGRGAGRPGGKPEPDKKGEARGDQVKARKRPRSEADIRGAQGADGAGVVDLCDSGDDGSSIGFQGDGTEGGKRSRRVLVRPEGEQEEEGGCASSAGDENGLEGNGGGRFEGGSSGFASFDVDDGDSDDFEPVRRKRKSDIRGRAAVQEDLSS